jgi:hypothetical protein
MIPTAIQSPAGGYTAVIRFHDGRQFTPAFTRFATPEAAVAFGEGWIQAAIRTHAQLMAAAGLNLRLVEG